MIDVKLIKKQKNNAASNHGAIATNGNGYNSVGAVKEAMHAARADLAVYAEKAGKANEADHAQEADHAKAAFDLDPDSPARDQFLSRIADDIAQGRITFKQGLTAIGLAIFKDGAHFGEFIKSLYAGKGAGIDKDGNAEFESVRVRSYLEAMEYIVNRLAAIEGDQILTEGDTIDRVVDNGDGTFGLYLHSKWDGYFTAQRENNVLKGIINTLDSGSGLYYTCWLRVNSVNAAQNYIEVTMYPDDETPAGRNYPPCELMKIARWGNQTDKTRQSCLYLSSTEGRIVKLSGVTKPIIDKSNYGATFGTVPDFLKAMELPLIDGQDYVYARGLIVQDIIRIDYQGKPIVTYVDRGQWNATADYYSETTNPATGIYETSDVWYKGCKYRCMKTGTHNPPVWNDTDWAMIEGNPDFAVEFAETDNLFDPDTIDTTLRIIAWLHNIDITQDISDTDMVWTRYSEDAQGVPRVASDNAWALKHAGAGKSLHITAADIEPDNGLPRTVRFMAAVTLRGTSKTATREIKFVRKGENGSDAVRYWLVPSVSAISMTNIVDGGGRPIPGYVSCRLVKQVGDNTPTTVTDLSGTDLAMSYTVKNNGIASRPLPYSGESVYVSRDASNVAIEFYLSQNGLIIDTATIPIICNGEAGEPGQDGETAISIKVSPQTVLFKQGKGSQRIKVYVDLYKGETQIPYYDAAQGNMTCSTLTDSGHDITDNLRWYFGVIDGRFYYELRYTGSADTNMELPFTVTYNGKKYPEKIMVQTIANGDRGPVLRGPQAWSDCTTGYNFQCGAENEMWKDVVLYGNNYYSCVKSHTKTVSNYPGSIADRTNGYWQLGDKIELVATKILLASYALVKNLGVESIDMKDSAGNILFQAKDGNVICKTGTFENVVFSGLMRKKKTIVTAKNFNDIFIPYAEDGENYYDVDFSKCGTWLELQYLPEDIIIYPKGLRALSGNTILLYNLTARTLAVSAPCCFKYDGGPTSFASFAIGTNQFASMECKIGSSFDLEKAYFVVQKGRIDTTLDN